jgi:hypothetical protein
MTEQDKLILIEIQFVIDGLTIDMRRLKEIKASILAKCTHPDVPLDEQVEGLYAYCNECCKEWSNDNEVSWAR